MELPWTIRELVRIFAFCVIRTGSLRGTLPGQCWHIISSGIRCLGYSYSTDGSRKCSGSTTGNFLFFRIYWTMTFNWSSFGGYVMSPRSASSSRFSSPADVRTSTSSVLRTFLKSSWCVWNKCHFPIYLCMYDLFVRWQGQCHAFFLCHMTQWPFPIDCNMTL